MDTSLLNDIFQNKSLLLHSASNISETIRCARYLKNINCACTATTIEDVYGLGDVFNMINPDVSVLSNGDKPSQPIDIEYDLNKLGYFVRDMDHDKASSSYITMPDTLKEKSKDIIGQAKHFRFGLCFSQPGNAKPVNPLEFENNLTIQQIMKAHYFSFIASEKESFKNSNRLDFREFCYQEQNYALIASIVAEMDIVISFDNVIAHLAGALGKPIFLLVPFDADVVSVDKFVASYSYVTIFRQQSPDDWAHVFLQISLLHKFKPEFPQFRPFNVFGAVMLDTDCWPLPGLDIESTNDLFKLLDINVGKLSCVSIETTSICNLLCNYCPNSTVGRDKEFMQESIFYKIVDSLKEYDSNYSGNILPHFYGEPLLDKRLESFVMYIKKVHPRSVVIIYTNGELLSIERYNSLKIAGVNTFKISQHTDMLSNSLSGLSKYLLDRKLPVEDIEYIKMDKKRAIYNRGGLVDAEPYSDVFLTDIINCTGAHSQMTFDYKGNAVLCCQDYLSNHTYGNIDERSISNIWNDKTYTRMRNLIVYGFLPLNMCRVCMLGKQA